MSEIIKYLKQNQYTGLDDIRDIKQDFYNKNIIVSYDNLDNHPHKKSRRVIFTSVKTVKSKTLSKMNMEANGLILHAPTWEPLVIPVLTSKLHINVKKVNKFLNKDMYDTYAIEDGTVINLYYHDKWVISTARGIEMNSCILNELTYTKMLSDVLDVYGINLTDLYDNLDKSYCYTIGFKHPDIHPFFEHNDSPIYKCWFIKQTNLTTLESSTEKPHILEGILSQLKISIDSTNDIFPKLKSSYYDYVNNISVNYGYMLVSKDPDVTGENSVIIFESDLLNYIRNLWYNGYYIKKSKENNYNKINYTVISSYLNDNKSIIFKRLFPQYLDIYTTLDEIEKICIEKIMDQQKKSTLSSLRASEIIDVFSEYVKNTISPEFYSYKIIKDIIHIPSNIDFYYELYNMYITSC